MTLTDRLNLLKRGQVQELHNVLVEAGIAHSLTGKHRDVFKRAKQRKVGALRAIYEQLETIPPSALPEIIRIVTQ